MNELPSLNFPSPIGRSNGRSRPSSWGRGGQNRGHYSALDINDMDQIPLMNDERGVASEDEIEEEENEEVDNTIWQHVGGKKRWQQRIRSHSTLVTLLCGGGWQIMLKNCFSAILRVCKGGKEPKNRTVTLGQIDKDRKFSANKICNQKYNFFTFLPLVFYEQFKFFINLYFLVVAFTQVIPQLRIGYLYTYWAPLGFVFAVTILREFYDDFKRYLRDRDINRQRYYKLTSNGKEIVTSSAIQVSDILIIEKNQRIPADLILLRTTEKNGSCFLRTDQLDGETDWKLREAVPICQALPSDDALLEVGGTVLAEKPQKSIHDFIGTFSMTTSDGGAKEDPLSVENVLWSSTVLASGTAIGVVIYTGAETRSVMNTSSPRSKIGLVDLEINRLTKILFVATVVLSLVLLALKGFGGSWFVYLIRFIILFSYIIPISLRVNLDMGKMLYSWIIQKDKNIPDTLVRTSTIPEELGRVEYLLSDKTGTLTRNEMVFRKLHIGLVSYSQESMSEIKTQIRQFYSSEHAQSSVTMAPFITRAPAHHPGGTNQLIESVKAIALCHNVTPVMESKTSFPDLAVVGKGAAHLLEAAEESDESEEIVFQNEESGCKHRINYQASSPDEIALVNWTQNVGVTLIERDLNSMKLKVANGDLLNFEILKLFPFTSESKRMGVIIKDLSNGVITFYMKGADVVMANIVRYNDWMEEECGNMAREGLRTLVVGRKVLSEDTYTNFEARYRQAKLSLSDRSEKVGTVIQSLEENLELLCITGVEDQLQHEVRPTLELLRNAGIKVWMLTGDKLETATSIAISSKLISRSQSVYSFKQVSTRSEAHNELNNFRKKCDSALIISGSSLELCLSHYELEFVELACQCPVVVCCRCSPTDKARVVKLLRTHTKKPVAAIGDGGNDVSMIQAANVGIGLVGREGKQASLAADFSITNFHHVSRLLVWHGRNSYKRSAALSQFVIHRGLIISVMQAVFCAMFYFAAVALYEGILMVGYTTIYTMAPVLSLVLDEDVSPDIALMYPELYQDLMKGRSLTLKTFFIWVLISIYQGGVIMLVGFLLFESQFIHVVSITFTALILTELLMVALTIRTWHGLMIAAELFSIAVYITSLVVLKDYFDPYFLLTFDFVWKTVVITASSCIPLFIAKLMQQRCAPSSYTKLLKKNSMFRNCFRFTF